MNFNIINYDNWKRKEYFELYYNTVPCSYSMTAEIDITKVLPILKSNELKFYPFMIYSISSIVNAYKEFRMDRNENKKLGFYDTINPSYTIFHKDTETFSNIWTEFNTDFSIFYSNYQEDLHKYGTINRIEAKPLNGAPVFPVSAIPWATFTGFHLHLQKGHEFLLPIFTMGKFYEQNGKTMLPLSIQVHHAVCDGFHVSRFVNALQNFINEFKL